MDPIFEKALALSQDLKATPKNLARVSESTSPEAARWAFTQWTLRGIAHGKFKQAGEMLFTREGLEQASHEEVARYHASRFPPAELVADLSAGIGADLIALSARGPAIGYEIDPERAECAQHNLQVFRASAKVVGQDSLSAAWPAYVWADPSRRVLGKRTLDPEQFSPSPRDLSMRMRKLKLGGVKLSPMLSDEFLRSLGGSLEFVSFGGECREAIVWLGSEAGEGRYAVHVESGERLPESQNSPMIDQPSCFLFEADPAAIRAHALGSMCERHALSALADSNGYLTGDRPASSPWLKQFQILNEPTGDLKRLQSDIAMLQSSVVAVKSRAGIDVEILRRKLKEKGPNPVVIIAYSLRKSVRYVIARSEPPK